MERLFAMRFAAPVVVLLLLTACPQPEVPAEAPVPSTAPSASPGPGPTEVAAAEPVAFVGGAACAECHAREARAWAGSDHDLAMELATEDTVLGSFEDSSFTDAGATTRFHRGEDGGFRVRAIGPDGEEQSFPVRYVFGVRPLQQYLVDIGGGRLQAHPVAWDVEKAEWLSLYPGEEIPLDDPLHWTRFGLNWNQGCADCHSTNLRKQYDPETNTYDTVWSEIDVSCEACHGPGEDHVAWARADGARDDADLGLLVDLGVGAFTGRDRGLQRTQIDTCAPCHSRRALVHPQDAWGVPFTESYRPEVLGEELYHADGQILDEVYVYGSFLQSRMFAEGVTCTDCHDPHTLKLVAEGNALCAQCHVPATYDAPDHTHHRAGSEGSACVACHMAETTYMQVDPRRDHGFHIPRPDLTVELGVPNACSRCHADQTAEWARDRVVEWFGPNRPDDVHETRAMAAARTDGPAAAGPLAAIVANPERSAILRASALHFLQTSDPGVALAAARSALNDPEPFVRSLAVVNTAAFATSQADFELLVPLLSDESRLVRTEAAISLSRIASQRFTGSADADTVAYEAALGEYVAGQMASADQPAAQMNLGVLRQNAGDDAGARAFYQQASRIEPAFVPARFNLAMLDATGGRSAEAEDGFREVIRRAPELAEAKYSLGLLLAEDKARLEESSEYLRAAARAAPDNPRFQYNAGLSVQHLGRPGEAEGYLRAAVNLRPNSPEFRNALAIFYVQQARWEEAMPQAERLLELVGAQPEVVRLVAMVRARAAAHPE